jgi:hypothetical protein
VLYSALTKFVEGKEAGFAFLDSTGIQVFNLSIQNLYKTALLGSSFSILNSSSIIVEINDPEIYYKVTSRTPDGKQLSAGLETMAWKREFGYSYELRVPPMLAGQKQNIMLNELNRYFGLLYGIEGVIEKRKRDYLALVRINTEEVFASKGGSPEVQKDKYSLKIRNQPMRVFAAELALPLQRYPIVINETGYAGNIDLELNGQLSDLETLNKELIKYGLELRKKEKVQEVGVIRLKANNSN